MYFNLGVFHTLLHIWPLLHLKKISVCKLRVSINEYLDSSWDCKKRTFLKIQDTNPILCFYYLIHVPYLTHISGKQENAISGRWLWKKLSKINVSGSIYTDYNFNSQMLILKGNYASAKIWKFHTFSFQDFAFLY